MGGPGAASPLKPSAILLLISGSLLLTAIVLAFAPHTITSSDDYVQLTEVELDGGDIITLDIECLAEGAIAELTLLEQDSTAPDSSELVVLSRKDGGFDGSITAQSAGLHELAVQFQELEGEAKVKYSIKGKILTIWVISLVIAVPAGAWGLWLKKTEDDGETQ